MDIPVTKGRKGKKNQMGCVSKTRRGWVYWTMVQLVPARGGQKGPRTTTVRAKMPRKASAGRSSISAYFTPSSLLSASMARTQAAMRRATTTAV